MLIDIVVGTFGSKDWEDKNADLCHRMSVLPGLNNIISVHGDSLAKARNRGAKMSNADYIIFLDADDFLDSEYVNSMHDATDLFHGPMIFKPMTMGFYESGESDSEPSLIPNRNIFTSNSCVIGSMISRFDFVKVGGFKEYPILEDWELFLNLICNTGAKIKIVDKAIYCVGVRDHSRNNDQSLHGKVYSQIVSEYREFSKYIKNVYLD